MAIVAVSGANGHIGAVLVRELLHQGHAVRALIFHREHALSGLPITKIYGDARDPQVMQQLVQGADRLINLAALISIWPRDAQRVYELNQQITWQAIQACLNASSQLPLIHFSSIHSLQVYPQHEQMDESRPLVSEKGSAYERSKAVGERMILAAVETQDLKATILNPTSVLGPYDYYPSLLGQAIIGIYKRSLPFLLQGGYNFVDVRDVAQATVQAMAGEHRGEKYILGGHYLLLRELAALINQVKGQKFPFVFCHPALARMSLPLINLISALNKKPPLYTRESIDILASGHQNISIQKAQMQLAYRPRPIADSVKDALEWYKSQKLLT